MGSDGDKEGIFYSFSCLDFAIEFGAIGYSFSKLRLTLVVIVYSGNGLLFGDVTVPGFLWPSDVTAILTDSLHNTLDATLSESLDSKKSYSGQNIRSFSVF